MHDNGDNPSARSPTMDASEKSRALVVREPHQSYWWLWVVLLLGLIVGGYFVTMRILHRGDAGAATTSQRNRAPNVVTVIVERGDMNIYLQGLGSVVPLNNNI